MKSNQVSKSNSMVLGNCMPGGAMVGRPMVASVKEKSEAGMVQEFSYGDDFGSAIRPVRPGFGMIGPKGWASVEGGASA